MRHVTRLAFGQVLAKHLLRVAAHTGIDQKAREVRARDQGRVAHVLERAFVGAGDARLGQLLRHVAGARTATVARVGQALHQWRVVGVEAQPDDVDRGVGKGDRDFDAAQVVQPDGLGRCLCALLAAHLVMVGQRPEVHAAALGARGQFFGCQGAVGDDRVAMQVRVGVGSHIHILRRDGVPRCPAGHGHRAILFAKHRRPLVAHRFSRLAGGNAQVPERG